jgi:antitoxin ParD1/3/4
MAQSSAISLDSKQQELVDRLVQAGRYEGANDVIAMGLKLLEERERNAQALLADIEAEIEAGIASGKSTPMESATELLAEFRSIR